MSEDDEGSRTLRATYRSAPFVVAFQATAACLIAAAYFGRPRGALGVPFADVLVCIGAIACTNLVSTYAFHRHGEQSARYKVPAVLELLTYQVAMMAMIHRSGSAVSLVWILWLGQAAGNAGITEHAKALLAVAVTPPVVLAIVFLVVDGDPSSASACLVAAAVGYLVFSAGFAANRAAAEARREREAAREALAAAQAREEKARIARDLHDGVAADLVALAAQADLLGDAGDPTRAEEVGERARRALDELRSVVWAMRAPDREPEALAAFVEARCRELFVGPIEVDFRMQVERVEPVPGPRALDLVRIAQECCRNALLHAAPTAVSVELRIGDALELTVANDGAPMPPGAEARHEGGLANIRARVAGRGLVAIERGARTTLRIRLDLP